ncbi:short-chain dehydrogenase reductase sdr [Moniliophthora roreri]|nr:short-chain dehydrogenase reductase sdr [Moniliophthora roreri]
MAEEETQVSIVDTESVIDAPSQLEHDEEPAEHEHDDSTTTNDATKKKPKQPIQATREAGKSLLPFSRVQKIIKADKDIPIIAKDATFLISIATEEFIKRLIQAGQSVAEREKRATVQVKDLATVVRKADEFLFLEEILNAQLPPQEKRKPKALTTANSESGASGGPTLFDHFNAPTKTVSDEDVVTNEDGTMGDAPTPSNEGIGRHTAVALSAAGWTVAITARRSDALEETKSLMNLDDNRKSLIFAGDVTDEAFVKSLFEETVKAFGRLDLLFNNAGMAHPLVPIDEVPLEQFQQVISVNLIAPFICTREAVRVFKSQSPPGGRIINNGSISAMVPRPFSYAYTASKHALTGLTKTTSLEGREYNIACTQINIGNTSTEMADHHAIGARQPDGRVVPEAVMAVEHVVNTVVHIAGLPNDVTVLEATVIPTKVPFVGRG